MKSPKRIAFVAAILAGATLFSTAADAALIARDYATPGDGLLTYDTNSGLEWLDFSVSYGHAPGAALATHPGFHMASRDEVTSLFVGAGIPADHVKYEQTVYFPEDVAAGHLLSQTIGVTGSYFGGAVEQTYGRVLRPDGAHYDIFFWENRSPPATPIGLSVNYLNFGNSLNAWGSNQADFLVRAGAPEVAGVPEPATWAMMLAGFGLLGGGLRRRAKLASA